MNPIILGYWPDWAEALPPSKLPYRLFTHLCHAFAKVDSGGVLTLPQVENSAALCRGAHAAGVKVLLSVGGGGDGSAGFAAAVARPDFVDQLVRVMAERGYDGLDIDWEYPTGAVQTGQCSALLQALRQRLPKVLLTMAVPASDWSGKGYDAKALAAQVDWLNIMTYDFAGPWSDRAGHNAPYTFCEAGIRYWLERGVPREKIVLGLASYGHGFRASALGAATPKGEHDYAWVRYNQIPGWQKAGWTTHRDEAERVPYLLSPDRKTLVSYDDSASIRAKVALARECGLRGYFFWEISQDRLGGKSVLVEAARSTWK